MNKTISILFATSILTTPVFGDQLRVVVDIPPIHGIVNGVLGSNANITTLIGSGIDPHNYTMKPSHAVAVGVRSRFDCADWGSANTKSCGKVALISK